MVVLLIEAIVGFGLSFWGATQVVGVYLHHKIVKIFVWFLSIAGTLATVALSEAVRQSVAAAFQ